MTRLPVRVQPGAKRGGLLGRLASGEWKLAVTAPPVEGRANEAVVELLSELLGVSRRQLRVARGAASRGKWIEVEGLTEAEVSRRLAAALAGAGGTHAAHGSGTAGSRKKGKDEGGDPGE